MLQSPSADKNVCLPLALDTHGSWAYYANLPHLYSNLPSTFHVLSHLIINLVISEIIHMIKMNTVRL